MANRDDLDDPAQAFDQLRREVSLCVRAVQGLAAERQTFPDYAPLLSAIEVRLKAVGASIERMGGMPAMQITPQKMGEHIGEASHRAREQDQRMLSHAHQMNGQLTEELRQLVQRVRTANAQSAQLRLYAAAGFAGGVILMLAGWWTLG